MRRFSIRLLSVLCAVGIVLSLGGVATAIARGDAPDEPGMSLFSGDDIDYVYRHEDGKLYRRLFNYTRNRWVEGSSWERV